ncbi:hypothetical protein FFWV33_00535 [Flavobacterium faecale]|uniref:Uncharacterized protein n=1 Tax=Flavobacterium faecale TaxID=1355330 RepID=A0A2S1L8N2_9FLAO|nr:hypothetical protein [Flavobacterium faecale]AWG20110.1 hypothetical protein FFWV33_00535 [Flavobacterium faecale]
MKNSKRILAGAILVSSLCLNSCQKRHHDKEAENVVEKIEEESVINDIPNPSDAHFSEAIKQLEAKNYKEVAQNIQLGIQAIKQESKGDGGLYKVNLDNAIAALEQISTDFNSNKIISESTLKEVVANAEINVAHDYLATSDVYTIVQPEVKKNNTAVKRMENNLAILKQKETAKVKLEVSKERQLLINEGQKLQTELKVLQAKINEHIKRSDAHIKNNYPEEYEEII